MALARAKGVGVTEGVFLYSDRGSTTGRGAAVGCQPGVERCRRVPARGGGSKVPAGGGGVAVTEQRDES